MRYPIFQRGAIISSREIIISRLIIVESEGGIALINTVPSKLEFALPFTGKAQKSGRHGVCVCVISSSEDVISRSLAWASPSYTPLLEEDRVNRMIPKLSRLGRKLCSTWIWLARLVKGDRLTVPPSRANEPLFAKREEGSFVRFPVFFSLS